MPLVPKTKMADVGKLISLWKLLVRKDTWLMLTTTSATFVSRFWSRLHDKDCLYILSCFKNSFFPFWLPETAHTHTHTHTHTLSLSFTFWLLAVNPTKIYTFCNHFPPCFTFTVRLAPASKTTTLISSNHWKKQTTNMGEDTFLLTYIIRIQ